MNKYAIAIHGGAGTILKSTMTPEKEKAYLDNNIYLKSQNQGLCFANLSKFLVHNLEQD